MVDFAGNKTFVAAGAVAAYASILRVMKLTIVLLVAGLVQANAYTGHSQQLTMDVKDESLVRVFAIIKKQTGYVYFGATEILAKARPVTIRVKNQPLLHVLDLCFKDQPLEYTINGKTIAVSEKKSSTSGGANGNGDMSSFALIDVRGRVTNEQNDPVAGVSVQVKGTRMGTSTNGDGEFTLSKVPHDAVLVLTAVNIQSIEALVDGRRSLDLKVKGKTGKLDEVQVIAYGKTSQRFNVGNVATVKAEDIEKQPVQNPLLALQGRVPGLEVTQLTGMNGGGVTVRIQGRNSINSGLEPLVVIDGVPFSAQLTPSSFIEEVYLKGGSPLNYINPADIESIDVLKDADATAIYGSRAANGAILITTKKGKVGRTKLNINLQQGWGKVANKVEMLNTRQYLDMRYEAYRNDGINWTAPSFRANDLKIWDTTRYTNWQKTLLGKTAQYSNISASVSGGTPAIQYLIGATYNRQTTVFPGDFDDKRGAVNFNINGATANKKFRISLSGNYMYDQNHLPGVDLTQQAILLHPHAPALHNADGTLNWAPNAAGASTWDNPLIYTQNRDFSNNTKNLVSSVNLNYSILPGLEVRSSFGYTHTQSDIFTATKLEFYRPERRPTSQRDATYAARNMNSWIIEPQLQYSGRVGKGKIDGLLGSAFQRRSSDVLTLLGTGYNSDLLLKSFSAAQNIGILLSNFTMYKYNALFGRFNYIWDDKYIVNLTARRDGSSRFGSKNKFHNFSSAGLGWVFSGENWIKRNLPFLSFGKLRVSYGTTGNDQIPDYSYLGLYDITFTGIPYQNSSGLYPSYFISNPNLQWENTRKWQWGIDIGLINDRIIINATYALNRSSNQLVSQSIPIITGFSSITENFPATVQNTSWEFTVNTSLIKRKDFNWTSGFNLTIPRNKLVSFPNIESTSYASGTQGVIVGQPLGISKYFTYVGVNPSDGRYLVLDENGTPTSDPALAVRNQPISTLTTWYGGLQNSLSFKGFQLDLFFQVVRRRGSTDFLYYNGFNAPGIFLTSGSNQPVTVLNRWQKPGDNATIARYTSIGTFLFPPSSNAGISYDASYIRLKNIALSWQFPSQLVPKSFVQRTRLYFQGQNLVTITNYPGLDPETGNFSLPPLQLWTLGLQIEL